MSFCSKPILISGGGIGGLATACFLGQKGFPVLVFEQRSFDNLEIGLGLQLSPNATRILHMLGLDATEKFSAHQPKALHIHTLKRLQSHQLASLNFPHGAQNDTFPYWTLRRSELHRRLYAYACTLPSVTLYGEHIYTQFTVQGKEIQLTTLSSHGETSHEGQLLIGADGIHSPIRHHLSPLHTLSPSGMCAFRRVVSSTHIPDIWRENAGLWLSPNGHIVHYPLDETGTLNIVVVQKNRKYTVGKSPFSEKWLVDLPKPLHWLSTFTATPEGWQPHPLYISSQRAPFWGDSVRRTLLLGDSAHPILPFLAQGAGLALEDAYALSLSFAETRGNMPDLFLRYTQARHIRTQFIQAQTRFIGHMYHLPSFLTPFRNCALRVLGSYIIPRLQNPIYSYGSSS
jgi:salicylate hydroxylase